jgi:uncharacterized protein (DUF4415 family)
MKKVTGFDAMDAGMRERMAKLAAMAEQSINVSDIPEWTKEDFDFSIPFSSVWKSRKEQITARIDVDILLWLKSHGKGYQTFMNNLLRKEMLEELRKLA